jgi:hypothetical protein
MPWSIFLPGDPAVENLLLPVIVLLPLAKCRKYVFGNPSLSILATLVQQQHQRERQENAVGAAGSSGYVIGFGTM